MFMLVTWLNYERDASAFLVERSRAGLVRRAYVVQCFKRWHPHWMWRCWLRLGALCLAAAVGEMGTCRVGGQDGACSVNGVALTNTYMQTLGHLLVAGVLTACSMVTSLTAPYEFSFLNTDQVGQLDTRLQQRAVAAVAISSRAVKA